jgi:hypothetical protein
MASARAVFYDIDPTSASVLKLKADLYKLSHFRVDAAQLSGD